MIASIQKHQLTSVDAILPRKWHALILVNTRKVSLYQHKYTMVLLMYHIIKLNHRLAFSISLIIVICQYPNNYQENSSSAPVPNGSTTVYQVQARAPANNGQPPPRTFVLNSYIPELGAPESTIKCRISRHLRPP